jgi:prepilin-type N-terminal cleavage/methylation domain-containing protein
MSRSRKQIRGQRSRGNRNLPAGFTLVEMLAAMLFMAIVIPVALQGLRIASRAGAVAARKGVAVQLAENKLNELIVTSQWHTSGQGGDCGAQWPGYQWTVKNEAWSGDTSLNNLRLLTVEVTYPVQNQSYNVHLSTVLPDTVP